MSRDWIEEGFQVAGKAIVEIGNISYEEFAEILKAMAKTGMSHEEFVESRQEASGLTQEGDA